MNPQDQAPNPNQLPGVLVNPQPSSSPPQPVTPPPTPPQPPQQLTPPLPPSSASGAASPAPQPQVVVSDRFSQSPAATVGSPGLPDVSNLFQPDTVGGMVVGHHGSPIRKPLIAALVVLVLVAVIATVLVMAAAGGKTPNSVKSKKVAGTGTSTVTTSGGLKIPSSWKTLDTGLGFTVKAPSTWKPSESSDADFNDLLSKAVNINASGDSVELSSDSQTPDEAQDQVIVSIQQLATQKSQQAFEEKITKLSDADAALLDSLGVKKEDVKISSRKLPIDNKQWLEVTSDIPGQLSRTLYLWQNDHAIAIMVQTEDQQKLALLSDSYLYPMAASLIVK